MSTHPNKTPDTTLEIDGLSDAGILRGNSENQDYVLINKETLPVIAVLADGAGGHMDGKIAARKTADYTIAMLREAFSTAHGITIDSGKELIRTTIQTVSKRIYKEAGSNPEEPAKMASTLDLLIFWPKFVFTGHVGDGVILRRAGTKFVQVTSDHNAENDYMSVHNVSREVARRALVQRGQNPRHLVQAMGLEDIQPDVEYFRISPGDEFAMYSDGLTKTHALQEITAAIEKRTEAPSVFVKTMIAAANSRKAPDNVSVVFATTRISKKTSDLHEDATLTSLTPNKQVEILARVPFFSQLTELQLNRVYNLCQVTTCEAGNTLFNKGDPSDSVMIVLRGELSVIGGIENVEVNHITAGQFVGESAILDQPNVRTAKVIARDRADVLVLPGDKLKCLMNADVKLANAVNRYLANVLFGKNLSTTACFERYVKQHPTPKEKIQPHMDKKS